MTYYKAEVLLYTEDCWLNPKTGAYEGLDPDSFQDHGVIATYTASTLQELKEKLNRMYSLEDAEEYEGRLELQYEGEHDYRTPADEQIPFYETYVIVLSKVEETSLDARTLLNRKEGSCTK